MVRPRPPARFRPTARPTRTRSRAASRPARSPGTPDRPGPTRPAARSPPQGAGGSVVVHPELTTRGPVPFQPLPALSLVLVTRDGQTISKAPVSLSSRPPHRIGVAPGETAGGHTVYVVPEATEVT